jgi:hypothetical protein
MKIKTKMILMTLLGAVAHGIVCAESKPDQTNVQPVPARRYDVAAYVWPAYQFKDERWNQIFKQGIGEWEIIRECKPGFPGHEQPNVPLWGYEDESEPKVMEKKIATAVKYGVNVFIYDWYWYDNQPFLEKGINDGFLKAKNCQDIQFYLMWANHDGGSAWDKKKALPKPVVWPGAVDRATFDTVVDRVISRYMSQPNYYKIDGKPVFSIYELGTLIKGLGGVEQTRDALASFRSKVKAAGFPDLHFQTILWGEIPASVSQVPGDKTQSRNNTMTALGIDSLTSYQWCHTISPKGPYSGWADRAVGQWAGWAKEFSMPYFPHVSVGWDTNPRRNAYDAGTIVERSPERFQAALESARQHVDQHGLHRLITVNAWNEWSEGSSLEPDERYGYKFLEAVKNVFGADGSGRSVSATPALMAVPVQAETPHPAK